MRTWGALCAGTVLLLFGAAVTAADYDLWGYLAFGRLFWSGAGLVTADPFSYVPTVFPWVHNEWLTSVLYFPLYHAFGGAGLAAVRYAAAISAAGLSLAACRARGGRPGWWLFCLAVTLMFWASILAPARARIFSLVLFCLAAWLLEGSRKKGWKGRGIALALVLGLWANLHAGFWLGIGLVGIYVLGEILDKKPLRAPAATLAACLATTLANPYGPGLWMATLSHAARPDPLLEDWITAWASLDTRLVFFGAAFGFLSVMAAAVLASDPDRDPRAVMILAVTTLMAALHVQFTAFLAVAATTWLPPALARAAAENSRSRLTRGAVFAVLIVTSVPLLVMSLILSVERLARPRDNFLRPFTLYAPAADQTATEGLYYPKAAAAFIREKHPNARILPEYAWGSYLIWTLPPSSRVGMDGRSQTVYPKEVRGLYWEFAHGTDRWREFLAAWPPDLILLRPGSPPCKRLDKDPAWRIAFQDPGSVLFEPNILKEPS